MSDAESDKGVEFTLEQKWVVTWSSEKWVLETKADKGGRDYLKVFKFDRSLVKFCLQKPMVVGQRSGNVAMMDKLLEMRKAASVQAVHEAKEEDHNKRKRKVRNEDASLVEDYVTIELDEIDYNGKRLGGYGARCLWGLDKSVLWIELCRANLEYLRGIIAMGQDDHGRTIAAPSFPKVASPKKKQSPKKSPSKQLRRLRAMSQSPRKSEGSKEASDGGQD